MKNTIIILLISMPLTLSAYTWSSFGPSGVHANDIVFNVGANNSIVICANDGLYISDNGTTWYHHDTYGLPVRGAIHLNDTSFIFVMGAGSFSDGIYLFSFNTMQQTVLNWTYIPEFIYQSDYDDYFYCGYYAGLLYSEDGLDWVDIPYFIGKKCVWMDNNYHSYVVAQSDTAHDIHYSDDGGKKWYETNCPYIITDFSFMCSGELYGIFPGFSNSSGLYSSLDFGLTWNLEIYSDNMITVGYDACVNIFTGWESSLGASDGVAIFDPFTKTFTFINAGLPNRNINRFGYNPQMSSMAMFACTDSGVYILQNYIVDIEEVIPTDNALSVFPNPFNEQATIEFNPQDNETDIKIEIYSLNGEIVREIQLNLKYSRRQQVLFHRKDLKPGVYFLRLREPNNESYKKIIISGR